MSFDTDLAQIFKSDGVHIAAATIGGSTIYGTFDMPFSDIEGISGLGAEFTALRSDLSAVVYGASVTVLGTDYTVREMRPTGGDAKLITLVLEEDDGQEDVASYEGTTRSVLFYDNYYNVDTDASNLIFRVESADNSLATVQASPDNAYGYYWENMGETTVTVED